MKVWIDQDLSAGGAARGEDAPDKFDVIQSARACPGECISNEAV